MSQNKPVKQLRADAANVLFEILENGKSSRECLPKVLEGHSDQDKAWIQEMVYGVLRQLPLLQYWLRILLDKPLKKRFKVLEHLIMVGFYQLAFTRVSTHAAVSETVSATKALNCQSLKGLVNAVLRNFIRQELELKMPEDTQITSGLPKWLYKKLAAAYPRKLDNIIQQIQHKPPIWLRVNTSKISRQKYTEELTRQNIDFDVETPQVDGLVLAKTRDITTLPGFNEGWFAVQDGAAQLAAHYLAPQKNDRVLDCCAAPGGKTCHLVEVQPSLKECVALEVDAKRAMRIEENLTRLGHTATLVTGDALTPQQWWDGNQFDRILLDAPCSATGIIRRHPDVKWLRKSADIAVLVDLQSQILDTIWSLLKPGGTLLYATCSILPEENSQQVSEFLQRTANAELDPINAEETNSSPGRQILPGEGQMDGFYYARLLKSKD